MNDALFVLREIINELHIQKFRFTFLEHSVGINWRQTYQTFQQRKKNIASSTVHPPFQGEHSFLGAKILEKKFDPKKLLKKSNNVISVSSKVISPQRKSFHLPLMNFHPVKKMTVREIVKAIETLLDGMPGYLLHSGRYYHFYGQKLLTNQEWIKFNSQFLMPTILVSERYIGHGLYRGFNTLRLTTDSKYKTILPRVCHRC